MHWYQETKTCGFRQTKKMFCMIKTQVAAGDSGLIQAVLWEESFFIGCETVNIKGKQIIICVIV